MYDVIQQLSDPHLLQWHHHTKVEHHQNNDEDNEGVDEMAILEAAAIDVEGQFCKAGSLEDGRDQRRNEILQIPISATHDRDVSDALFLSSPRCVRATMACAAVQRDLSCRVASFICQGCWGIIQPLQCLPLLCVKSQDLLGKE